MGGDCPLAESLSPPLAPNEITLCKEVYGELPFWVPVSPPCRPLILKSLATPLKSWTDCERHQLTNMKKDDLSFDKNLLFSASSPCQYYYYYYYYYYWFNGLGRTRLSFLFQLPTIQTISKSHLVYSTTSIKLFFICQYNACFAWQIRCIHSSLNIALTTTGVEPILLLSTKTAANRCQIFFSALYFGVGLLICKPSSALTPPLFAPLIDIKFSIGWR